MLNNICLQQFMRDMRGIKSYAGLNKLLQDAPIDNIMPVKYNQFYYFIIGNHSQNILVTLDMMNKNINAVERVNNGEKYDCYAETTVNPTEHGRKQLIDFIYNNIEG